MEVLKGFGRMFYLVRPSDTYIENVEDIPKPDYVQQAIPYFFTFIILEYLIQWWKGKPKARINDGVTSMSLGLYLGFGLVLFRSVESYFYIKVYENFRIYEWDWNSATTWFLTALGVDFGYYWVHRAAHELNFFWAQHQVHHSSEEYNLTTALRQSVFQGWIAWIFYLPLAFLGFPPSIFLIHSQFNLLFQFWIHTELIDSLGPLEFILNTPRHHRIHHGSNRYCLDKNYAGALIIWDRMFGTFAAEKPNEKIVYGLVEDVNSFNPFWLQFFYFPKSWNRMKEFSSMSDKLNVLIKGPGWSPGKPRLGDPMDVPMIPQREKFDPKIQSWQSIYAVVHFLVVLTGFDFLSNNESMFGQLMVILAVIYVMFSLTSIGLVLENRRIGTYSEIFRTILSLFILQLTKWGSSSNLGRFVMILFFLSSSVWIAQLVYSTLLSQKTSDQQKKKGK